MSIIEPLNRPECGFAKAMHDVMLMRKEMAQLRNVAEAATVRKNRNRVRNRTDDVFDVGKVQDILLLVRLMGRRM